MCVRACVCIHVWVHRGRIMCVIRAGHCCFHMWKDGKGIDFLKMVPEIIYMTQSHTLQLRHWRLVLKCQHSFGRDVHLNLLLLFVLSFLCPFIQQDLLKLLSAWSWTGARCQKKSGRYQWLGMWYKHQLDMVSLIEDPTAYLQYSYLLMC